MHSRKENRGEKGVKKEEERERKSVKWSEVEVKDTKKEASVGVLLACPGVFR